MLADNPGITGLAAGYSIMGKQELKNQLLVLLKKEAFKKGKFTLSSGKISDYYLDGRIITLTPEGSYLCAMLILDFIKNDKIDAVGGPTLGADPIVGAIAALSHIHKIPLKTFIVRKLTKDHGMQRQIEGPALKENQRVILEDDVATTGKSLIEAKEALDKIKVKVDRAIVIVDRNEGARENLAQINLRLESIFKIEELLV
jgi:orotate phosphoribosyltransferase